MTEKTGNKNDRENMETEWHRIQKTDFRKRGRSTPGAIPNADQARDPVSGARGRRGPG